MMDVEVVVAQEIEFVGAKAREKYQLNQRSRSYSARAALGLNQAQMELKSQRQSRNKKLQADIRSQSGAGRVVEWRAD
jgi:hypothetical protein